jgi:hypothetical protein
LSISTWGLLFRSPESRAGKQLRKKGKMQHL